MGTVGSTGAWLPSARYRVGGGKYWFQQGMELGWVWSLGGKYWGGGKYWCIVSYMVYKPNNGLHNIKIYITIII